MNGYSKAIIYLSLISFMAIILDLIGNRMNNNFLVITGISSGFFIIPYSIFIVPKLLNKQQFIGDVKHD